MRDHRTYVLRRAAAQYERDGVISLDAQVALDNAGLMIEDVIREIESPDRPTRCPRCNDPANAGCRFDPRCEYTLNR